MSIINIKHFYLNMRINIMKEKLGIPDHSPLRATCIVGNWLKNKTPPFLLLKKNCDVKY